MVLVCVTTFKGRCKIQSRWENSEFLVEWQPYPNLPVYVVCLTDEEGHSHTLHRNYLLPICNNLEQEEGENAVGRGGSNEPTPVPHVENLLPVNQLTKSQLEGIPNSPLKQCEPVDPGSTGPTSPDSMDEGPQADDDTPVPLRQNSRKMRNQLPWRYQNFPLWQSNILPSAFDILVGLCICLHIMSCLYSIFMGKCSVRTLYLNHHRSARHK